MPNSEQINGNQKATRARLFWISLILAKASENEYLRKLRLQSQIHAENAPTVNAKRQAIGFNISESEDKGELYRLIIHAREFNPKNILDFSIDD